jgi:hypothetical protein
VAKHRVRVTKRNDSKNLHQNKQTTKAHARQTARESAHCGFPSTVDVNSFLLEATTALSRRAFKLIINDLPMSRIGKTTVVRMGTRVYSKLRAVSKKMGYGVRYSARRALRTA